jgi:hypothetical protein
LIVAISQDLSTSQRRPTPQGLRISDKWQHRIEGAEPCRIDERQPFKIKQDPGGMARLGLSQRTLQKGAVFPCLVASIVNGATETQATR